MKESPKIKDIINNKPCLTITSVYDISLSKFMSYAANTISMLAVHRGMCNMGYTPSEEMMGKLIVVSLGKQELILITQQPQESHYTYECGTTVIVDRGDGDGGYFWSIVGKVPRPPRCLICILEMSRAELLTLVV